MGFDMDPDRIIGDVIDTQDVEGTESNEQLARAGTVRLHRGCPIRRRWTPSDWQGPYHVPNVTKRS